MRDWGSTVYLAPEVRSDPKKKFDAIVNGLRFEFKNMHGASARTLKAHFLDSREQAPHVFINLEASSLSKHKIVSALIGARNSPKYDEKTHFPEGGTIILKIRGYRNLTYQDVNDLN